MMMSWLRYNCLLVFGLMFLKKGYNSENHYSIHPVHFWCACCVPLMYDLLIMCICVNSLELNQRSNFWETWWKISLWIDTVYQGITINSKYMWNECFFTCIGYVIYFLFMFFIIVSNFLLNITASVAVKSSRRWRKE